MFKTAYFRNIQWMFILLVMLSSCHSLLNLKPIQSSKLVGAYTSTFVQKGIDIPDHVQQTTIKLKEDATFQLESINSGYPMDTSTGTWEVSNDTLFLHLNTFNRTLHYKVKSYHTLQSLPYGKNNIPFKRNE